MALVYDNIGQALDVSDERAVVLLERGGYSTEPPAAEPSAPEGNGSETNATPSEGGKATHTRKSE